MSSSKRETGRQGGRERERGLTEGREEIDRKRERERERSRKMVCVLSVAAGVCGAGLDMKMQPWGIQAAPLLCAVRSFSHAFNLWGGRGGS